ncbi:putative FAD-dependent oxidoreductase [Hyphomicrobiales bacterium]|nr:putative FAD-dependent oxidoreductase [Hyphomicrobiales bacterium]CAH1675456.1 putative FAD-dependent oxidoreductase [Hyphomicrobiales bacterium]
MSRALTRPGSDRRRITVVGAGIFGMSLAWALSRAGHIVTLVDKGPIPNPDNSSFDEHRLIRFAYGPELGYMRLVRPAFKAWDQLWSDLGTSHYCETGALGISTAAEGWVSTSVRMAAEEGIACETLNSLQLAKRFPYIDTKGIVTAMYQQEAGLLFADRIAVDMARDLRRRGVVLIENCAVDGVDPISGRADLRDGRTLEADLIVLAAGVWLNGILPAYGNQLISCRRTVALFDLPADLSQIWSQAPMVMDLQHVGSYFVVPSARGTHLKIGTGGPVAHSDPDSPRELDASEITALIETAGRRLVGAERFTLAGARACYQMYAPDNVLLAEPLGDRAWTFSCCSGHGYKFAPHFALVFAAMLSGSLTAGAFTRMVAGDPEWNGVSGDD